MWWRIRQNQPINVGCLSFLGRQAQQKTGTAEDRHGRSVAWYSRGSRLRNWATAVKQDWQATLPPPGPPISDSGPGLSVPAPTLGTRCGTLATKCRSQKEHEQRNDSSAAFASDAWQPRLPQLGTKRQMRSTSASAGLGKRARRSSVRTVQDDPNHRAALGSTKAQPGVRIGP